ncbi:MAG TPA: SRPBCC family protein [Nocardioides sp.]|nr:SRPBCC family protein [Nocardioides sp.]
MAQLRVTGVVPASADEAWAAVSDLSRFDDWLSLHDGWRGEVPDELAAGQRIESIIKAKGIRNRIAWVIEDFSPPRHVALVGEGVGGTAVTLAFDLTDVADGTAVAMVADFKHPLLKGPMGAVAARTIKSDLEASMRRLVAIATA